MTELVPELLVTATVAVMAYFVLRIECGWRRAPKAHSKVLAGDGIDRLLLVAECRHQLQRLPSGYHCVPCTREKKGNHD